MQWTTPWASECREGVLSESNPHHPGPATTTTTITVPPPTLRKRPWEMLACDWLPRKWGCAYRVFLPSNRNCQQFARLIPVCSQPPANVHSSVATKGQRLTFILIFIQTDSPFDPIQFRGPGKRRLEPPSDLCLDPTASWLAVPLVYGFECLQPPIMLHLRLVDRR